MMDDYALVLNAGSSSLKFCVYRPAGGGRLEPRITRPDRGHRDRAAIVCQGRRGRAHWPISNWTRSARDGRAALDSLAVWLRSRYGGARVLGVGHRVVHGGARFTGPTVITPESWTSCGRLIPLAPLHQPYNLAAIEAVFERLAWRASGRLLRHELSPWPASSRRGGSIATGALPRPACSGMAFTACPTNTSPRSCRRWRRRSPEGVSSSLIWEVAPVCAP